MNQIASTGSLRVHSPSGQPAAVQSRFAVSASPLPQVQVTGATDSGRPLEPEVVGGLTAHDTLIGWDHAASFRVRLASFLVTSCVRYIACPFIKGLVAVVSILSTFSRDASPSIQSA